MATIPIPNLNAKSFALQCFDQLLKRFQKEDKKNELSIIAAGFSFEQWLSFECRIDLETKRSEFNAAEIGIKLDEYVINEDNMSVPRYWIDNEYTHVDLLIGETKDKHGNGGDDGAISFEFKVIHNNKNYLSRCSSIRNDLLLPAKHKQTYYLPFDRRYGVVAEVFKIYSNNMAKRCYPDQQKDIELWRGEVIRIICDGHNVDNEIISILKTSNGFKIDDPWLLGDDNLIRFHLLNVTNKIS